MHPADVERLVAQLDGLVEAGNAVIVVEHDMQVIAASDWVIDIGPGAGDEGGRIVANGGPAAVATAAEGRTAPYLARYLEREKAEKTEKPERNRGTGGDRAALRSAKRDSATTQGTERD